MDNGQTARRLETALRDRECWRLRVEEGLTQAQIADRVGLPQSNVSRALRRIGRTLAAEFAGDALQILTAHSQRLQVVYRESMDGWERSKGDQVTETDTDAAGALTTTRTRRTQHGDAAHLNAAMKAMAEERRIWGLDDPETVRALLRQVEMHGAEGDDGDG